jgi:hypothetical protein
MPRQRMVRPDVAAAVLGVVTALALGVAATSGLRAWLAPGVVKPVLEVRPESIRSISLSCRAIGGSPDPTPESVEFHDPATLREFAKSLHLAQEFDPNHPQCRTRCEVHLNTKTDSHEFLADWHCHEPSSGALLYFHSQGRWGLAVGVYRSDELEGFLSGILSRRRAAKIP